MKIQTQMGNYFEVIARLDYTNENGEIKKIKEVIVVDAVNFTDAEAKGNDYFDSSCNAEIININPTAYKEAFRDCDVEADTYYKAKISLITIDENTSKEKKTKITYLVFACSVKHAEAIANEAMKGSMSDYHIESIARTNISNMYYLWE